MNKSAADRRSPPGPFPGELAPGVDWAMRHLLMITVLMALSTGCGKETPALKPALAPDAPKDQPVDTRGKAQVEEYRAAIAPYVEKARQT